LRREIVTTMHYQILYKIFITTNFRMLITLVVIYLNVNKVYIFKENKFAIDISLKKLLVSYLNNRLH